MNSMRFFCALLLGLMISFSGFSQLNVTSAQQSGNWASYYVNNVLLGSGVTAFNITFSGDSMQIGEFDQTNSGIIIPDGVIMSSGDVEIAEGPDNSEGAGAITVSGNSDADLAQLSGFSIFDAAILEFDFVPQGDSVKFSYVFGSEEYDEYVCGSVNDAFGFFLSGPGIAGPFSSGAVNIATIPGTNPAIQVSINTVNNGTVGTNGMLSNCTNVSPNWNQNTAFYVQNTNDTTIQYDGYTVPLVARYEVNCGDTYHIKLAIADAGDGAFDSGVFLEGGSFSSDVVEVSIASVNGDSTINEGCGTATIQFTRTDTSDTTFTPLFFTGTATNGVDFTLLPDSIVLYPGQFDTTIVIDPFNDGITEGMEFITIEAWTFNPCGDTFISTGTLYFFDVPNLDVSLTDTILKCPADSLELEAVVLSGGPPPYQYTWSTGATGSAVTVPALQGNGFDSLFITVTDSCALFTFVDTLVYTRDVDRAPLVNIVKDTIVDCPGDSVTLSYDAFFGSGQSSFVWEGNDSSLTATVVIPSARTYQITMTDSCGRVDVDTAFLDFIAVNPITSVFPDTVISCPGDTITVRPQVSGGLAGYNYDWELVNPTYDDSVFKFVQPFSDTLMFFWVQDRCGRVGTDTIRVQIRDIDSFMVSIPDREVACDGVEVTIPSDAEGGLEPYTYSWNTEDTTSTIILTVDLDQSIVVTVTDFCGRIASAEASINTPEFLDLGLTLSGSDKLCFGEEYIIEAQGFGGAGDYTYDWIPQKAPRTGEIYEKLDSNLFRVVPNQTNIHLVRITDFCGNTYEDSLNIIVDPCIFIPNVITPNGDGMNDFFQIDNANNIPDAELVVYNRWGAKVYESSSYKNDWSPSELSSGVYFYVLRSEFFDELRGDVTVIAE